LQTAYPADAYYVPDPEAGGLEDRRVQEVPAVVFNRRATKSAERRSDTQSALVEMLLDTDDLERRRLLLIALQTGELKKSEAAELLRLVERLESVSGR
jgi:hypothetical protein